MATTPSNKELGLFRQWADEALRVGGQRSAGFLMTRAREVLLALQGRPEPIQTPNNVHPWGYFEYHEDTQRVHRDHDTIRIPLVGKEPDLLLLLLNNPLTRITYQEISQELGPDFSSVYALTPVFSSLRSKIGDINLAKDPDNWSRGLWRYINPWKDNETKTSGLILLNRTETDIQRIIDGIPDEKGAYKRF